MTPTERQPIVDSYELSPTQEGMLFHGLLGEASGVDLEQIVCSIRGDFDEKSFVAAFHHVASRHAILRTRFSYDQAGRPTQEVLESVEIGVGRLDLGSVDLSDRARQFEEALRLDRARGVDLRDAPAMRLLLVDFGPEEQRVVWTFHHALLDGRSFPIVLREVFAFYDAAVEGRPLELPLPRPYREYIEFLRGLDLSSSEAYWRNRLKGFAAPTPLVVDRASPDEGRADPIQGVFEKRLSRETTAALRTFAASRGVTLNTLLQAAWATLLHRYSRDTDVVFGVTRACRRSVLPDADGMVGLFINTLPLRVRFGPGQSLAELLAEVRALQVETRPHEHTPLVKVQAWSEIPRGRPLFDTLVVYENDTLDTTLRRENVASDRRRFSYRGQTNYPVTLIAYGDDEMLVRLENDRRRVDDAPASRMLGHLVTLLSAMPGPADRAIQDLPLLSEEEERASIAVPAAPAAFPVDRCLHQRFEEQVRRVPERVAAVCDGKSLTYGELDRRANALAHRLRSLGVGPDVLVGIRTERSLDIVVGILGILKAGGAYLPLDPAYPKERVEFMLADSRVGVVVTETALAADFASSGARLVLLDQVREESDQGPESAVGPANLAYVIYTSGSTGKPKGVLISHANVIRLFDATQAWFAFGEDDVWTLFHSYAFDFSVWEIWGPLLHGGRLVVVPYWVSRSPEGFRELLLREKVTVLNQTPSAFRQLVQADVQSGPPVEHPLRYVIFGGEALELQSLRPWFDRYGDERPKLVNMYGITETTVHVTYRPIGIKDLEGGAGSVIGIPIPDLRLVVLDPSGTAVPTGIPGEMYVGGAGVSRGYLGRPELTTQRFVPDRVAGGEARLYRTGDLARRLENGDLEYLGRIDDQVKIRGFRIELGEIEAVLGQHPDLTEAAVVVREDAPSDKRLVAYIVGDGESGALVERVKSHLRAKLPEYMVPAHIVRLSTLPLTANGKVDRRALPPPEYGSREAGKPFVAPRTATERALADIWAAVLGAPRVSIDDNFFEIGGDSILTIQLIARCRRVGLNFTPRELARNPTIAQLSQVVGTAPLEGTAPETPRGPVTPTPIQSWFLERRFANPRHWNQAFLFEVPAGIDVLALQRALGHVTDHHDAFRLRVEEHPQGFSLNHASSAEVTIARIDLTRVSPEGLASAIEATATQAQSALDPAQGPLLAAVHFDRGPAPGRLLLVVHHLVVDGVSWRLLLEDLETAYRALRSGSPVTLPPPSMSFQGWSRAIAEYAGSPGPAGSLARWVEILAADGTLPGEASGRANPEALARTLTLSLDAQETQALLQKVPSAYRTQINDVLLTALAQALRRWTGRDTHRIDMEGHGREEWIGPVDVSRTVGWFTSLYPVALDLSHAQDDGQALKLVKETLRQVPDRGLSYGVLRYASPDPEVRRRLAAPPPAELLFNYLGQFDQVVKGSELFRFADEPTGPWHGPANERTHRLEVIALVRDGRFETRFIYGAERDRPEVIARLAQDFVEALRALIRHCTSPGAFGYTPSDFPLARLQPDTLDRIAARLGDIEDVYPLSPMQHLFLSMEGERARLGFEQWVFRLRGPLDPVALRRAWEATVAAHAMLRTAFVTEGVAEPLQVVKRRVALPWAEEDWTGQDAADAQRRLEGLLRADRERGFELEAAPLNRVTLVRCSDQEHRLVWSTHHLYVDGWSWPLIFRHVGAAYTALSEGAPPVIAPPGRYAAYIGWLLSAAPDSRAFWQERLAGFSAPTPLPFESMPNGDHDPSPKRSLRLPAVATAALQSHARSLKVTLNTVIQAAWAILLGHLSARDDIVFGAAFSGRPGELADVETLVGPCVNNLPVRVRLDPQKSVADALRRLHEDNLEIAQHQYASLSDIQQWAGIPWNLRVFESLVVFQNYLVGEEARRFGAIDVEPLAMPEETNYPLTLTVTPGPQIGLTLLGRSGRFGVASLAMMLDGLAAVLLGIAERPDAPLAELQSRLDPSTKGRAASAPFQGGARRRQGPRTAAASEMERVVAEVWQQLFEVEDLDMEDNFFDLGGHSILLVQAHARLRERTGRDLSIVALLQYPTIRSLARHLGGEGTESKTSAAALERARMQRQALARHRLVQRKG